MNADDPRHGQPGGYDTHLRDGEEPCDACRAAAARYEYRRRIDGILGRRYTTHSRGTARRIQGLVALGWTFGEISDRLSRCHDYARKLAFQTDTYVRTSTAERVAEVYDQMSMTLPPTTTGQQRRRAAYARTTAKRNGWVVPLCWDDPDTDTRPRGMVPERGVPDPVVVERVLAGERHHCTPAERAEVLRRWTRSDNELERLTGWNVARMRREMSREDAA